jgi:hypothetical protein
MAASEIADMIPPETIAEIKKTDPWPLFKAFVAVHEGEAKGNLVGVGNIAKRWYKNVVSKLHDKIEIGLRNGLQLFHGHGATNDHDDGRLPIGRVVGKKMMEIAGRMSSVVACYIESPHTRLKLDVASIEANVDMDIDPKTGELYVTAVNDVQALALGNGDLETPGFSGATLLGQLQAFAGKYEQQKQSETRLRRVLRINETNRPEPLRLVKESKHGHYR